MAIRQGLPPTLKSVELESQFPPAISRKPIIFSHDDDDEMEKLEKTLARMRRRQLINAEAAKMVSELRPAELEEKEKDEQEGKVDITKKEPKRYNVDLETGVITVDEENGEHSYKDALLISSSIRAKHGEYDKAISLIAALREFVKPPEEQKAKKGFYVKDDGTIVADPENGDLTLSQARAISESRRALVTAPKEQITQEKLELLKRDMRETLEDAISELRQRLTPQEQEALFSIGSDGKPVINPKARLGINEFILLQMMENFGKKSDTFTFKDTDGNVLPLPDWLEINRFKREEARKDDRHNAIVDLIKEGREQLPKLIDGLKNMAISKETDEAMITGGWKGGPGKVKSAPCAACHEPINYTELPAVMPCPRCKTLNVLGDPVQQKEILSQLANQLAPERPERKEEERVEEKEINEEEKKVSE